jgi:murein L,D-transpeptidase YcbB/YkuD
MPQDKADLDDQDIMTAGRRLSRRATLVRGPLALAAACALAACGARPDRRAAPVLTRQGETELDRLRGGEAEVTVAGETLNAGLLRRFYERHDFRPVWTARPAQADALVEVVLRADEEGLDPEMFHASLLRRRETFPPLRRDLLLSDAFLSYADALARGAVPVERRKDSQVLAPEPVNVAASLDAAIRRADPAEAIAALAPSTPAYRALREALLRSRTGGRPGLANDRRKIEVNLERQRWLPRRLPADRVWVNAADQSLVLYRADEPVFSTRVVVGNEAENKQSPEFHATIEASFFNPPWVIPRDIVAAEILPRLERDPDYLTRHNMVLRANGEVEQLAGPEAGLGLIMFDMPNRFDVYLHDTPDRQVFNRDNRRISHGCIRVQNPLEFAALLMQQPVEAIHEGIAAGGTTRNRLPRPVPVFVIYQTAFVDADETLQFRPDFYSRDVEIWRRMQKRPEEQPAPVQATVRPTRPARPARPALRRRV